VTGFDADGDAADIIGFARALLADGGKGEAVCDRIICGHNRSCVNDDAATARNCPHRAAPQAECAPREAQPVVWIDAKTLQGFTDPQNCNKEQRVSIRRADAVHDSDAPLYAAPTPERADAEKDAALPRERIIEIAKRYMQTNLQLHGFTSEIDAAILAAKEKKS
jgi:hypothetical protein